MSKKKLVISDDLIAHMNNCPGKTRVWINDVGEWSNHKDAKYPNEVSRAEILSGKTVTGDEAADENAGDDLTGDKGTGDKGTEKIETPVVNTTDPKISVKVTAKNKKDAPPGAKVGDTFEIDNPDYEDPALK